MPPTHPYAAELAKKLERKSDHRLTIRFRTLLNGFGYYRRTEAAAAEIFKHLQACGLTCDLPADSSHSLDERVTIALGDVSSPSPAQPPAPASPPAAAPDPLDAISRDVDAVVEVATKGTIGSGFIIHPDGLVVTGRHVVEEDGVALRLVKVRLFPEKANEKTVDGVVFCSHSRLDFALLWLQADGPFPVLSIGDPQKLRYAQPVLAIGCPAGMPNVVSRGIISNPNASYRQVQCIQTDAAIDHGNSGGPLVTEQGEVVGINLWGIGSFDAAKFAVPIDYLTDDIAAALQHGRKACLEAAYCLHCGYTDYDRPAKHCRNCGAEFVADNPAPPEPPKEKEPASAEPSTTRSQALADAGAPPPPAGPSPEERKQSRQAAEAQIDEFMKKVGYANPAERTDEHGWRYVQLGSAEGRAGIVESADGLYLAVESPLMPLPSDGDLILPLMRALSEINMHIAGGARLGIKGEVVYIAVARPVVELRPNDFAECIHTVMAMADELDNPLIEKYGGTTKKRTASHKDT